MGPRTNWSFSGHLLKPLTLRLLSSQRLLILNQGAQILSCHDFSTWIWKARSMSKPITSPTSFFLSHSRADLVQLLDLDSLHYSSATLSPCDQFPYQSLTRMQQTVNNTSASPADRAALPERSLPCKYDFAKVWFGLLQATRCTTRPG